MAKRTAQTSLTPATFIEGSAGSIPLNDNSIDTVVTTRTLCTISDAEAALNEMRRVLNPGGHLLFVEHGLAPEESVRKWQNLLTPAWKCVSGGCHLNRPIASLSESAGFRRYWHWKSRRQGGRPQVQLELRALIRQMSVENPLWGAPRIHGELLKLGFEVSQSSVAKYMVRRRGPPSQGWRAFLRNHAPDIAAMDLFVVPTIGFELREIS
jgi:SAM-dependent methyltransferase